MSLVGCRVRMQEGEGVFEGEVLQEDAALGKLAVLLDSGELQNFFKGDLAKLQVVERRPTEQASPREGMVVRSEEELRQIFASVAPESLAPVVPERMGRPGGRNCHLLNLHRVDMPQLLDRRGGGEEPMARYLDEQGLEHRQLPAVASTSRPRLDANGHILGRGVMQGSIRERVWRDQDTPPQIVTPSRLYLVEEVGEVFEEAVARARAAPLLGLASEGELLGRGEPLAWLLLATNEDVFMFDVQALGEQGWRFGLRTILQDAAQVKVAHDCRALSDCLWHQHEVRLAGVWDTMAADMVFVTATVQFGLLPRYTRSQAHLLRDYLGVDDLHLAFPRYRRAHLSADLARWRERPLPEHLLLIAAREVLYLPCLHALVRAATLQPFHRAVALLNSGVRDRDAPDAAAAAGEAHQVPAAVLAELPTWDSEAGARRLDKIFLVDGDFVHNNVGNPDPVLIFSKDSMHQAMVGEPADMEPFASTLHQGSTRG